MDSCGNVSESDIEEGITCWICKNVDRLVDSSSETLNRSLEPGQTERLKTVLEKVTVKVGKGAGKFEVESFDRLSQIFMARSFANAAKNAYQWPLVFEYEHPGESWDVIFQAESNAEVPDLKSKKNKPITYGTLQRKRRGERPEEKTFSMLCAMFEEKNMPSFVINGYIWNKYCPKKLFDIMEGIKAGMKEGEIDLLVSVPGQCLISIEVKAVTDVNRAKQTDDRQVNQKEREMDADIEAVSCKAFEQCNKTLTFISKVTCDLFHEKNITFIKVAALPNCSRYDVNRVFCLKCSSHIITEDELTSIANMYEWFTGVMKVFNLKNMNSDYTGDLHERVIGRMLGPKSLVQTVPEVVQQTYSQITERHGTANKVRSRWFQLNPEQLHVALRNPKMLWLTGEPGSGKTVLAVSKIRELCVSGSCALSKGNIEKAFIIVMPGTKLLCQNYEEWLKGLSSECVNLQIDQSVNFMTFGLVHHYGVDYILRVIKRYQDNNKGCVLHFFVDESHMLLKETDLVKFKNKWANIVDPERLGHLWIIQNPDSTQKDDTQIEIPGFYKVHLTYIMRMSKQVIDFVNLICDRSFVHGHGVTGNVPTMFRMKCVCGENKNSIICLKCQHLRRANIIMKTLEHLNIGTHGQNELCLEDVVITMTDSLKREILPTLEGLSNSLYSGKIGRTMFNPFGFMGCEAKIIIVELESVLNTNHVLEAFTRPLGQLVLLDTGLAKGHASKKEAYEILMQKISTVASKGLIRIKDINI